MSNIYNRKMFRQRNARNALNQSAGVAPVQKFQVGGQVQTPVPYSTFSSPITGKTFRSRIPSGRGITSLQPFNIARRFIEGGRTVGYGDDSAISPGEYALLQASQTSNVAGDLIQDPTDTRLGGAIADVTRPFVQAGSGAVAFGRGLAEEGLGFIPGIKALLSSPQGASSQTPSPLDFKPKGGFYHPEKNPSGEKKADYDARVNKAIAEAQSKATPNTFGQRMAAAKPAALDPSFLASMGINEIDPTAYSSPIGPQPATPSRGVFQGPPVPPSNIPADERMARDQQIRQAQDITAQGGMYVTDEETGAFPASLDAQEDALKNLTDSLVPGAGGEGADAGDPLVETQATIDDGGEDDATPGTGTGTQEGSGVTGAADTKKEVDRVINSGTKEEQEKTLDGFIKEFMDKAPGYEGADSGLVLAKIGFAMAAGKSPRAIENISKAMSDGADMLIKDKAKKDEFNRQLKLSALQYGLTETGKISAEERAVKRADADVVEMVVGQGGTTYKDRDYNAGESVFISKGDLKAGSFPPNILGTSGVTALKNQLTANTTALKNALDLKKITPAEYNKQIEKYTKAVSSAIDAESGIALLEGAMITTSEGKVTGFSSIVDDAIFRGGNFFGMDLSENYGDKEQVRKAMRAALQDVIPVTLGATQSANSISNRDVDFLIEAYFGKDALNGGILTFATQNRTQMIDRLQLAADKMRKSQKQAFTTMSNTEKFLTPLYQPGTTESAVNILSSDQRRLQEAGLRAGGGEGAGVYVGGQKVVSSIGATRGDDGIIRLDLS